MDKIDRILKDNGITEHNCMSKDMWRDLRLLLPFFSNKSRILTILQHRIYNALHEGVGLGLYESSIEGQKVSMDRSARTPKQKEFLDKMNELYREYGMGIRYHPRNGMELFDLEEGKAYYKY